MTPARRAWITGMIARLELPAAALRADGTRAGPTIAACLDDVLARFRAELATCPVPTSADEPITWASPMFNAGGRFDPFAGEKWQRMLASAATCERLGAHDAATGFRKAAEIFRVEPGLDAPQRDPEILQITPTAGIGRSREAGRGTTRPLCTGANMPPPPPMPFTAGPQLGLFG